MSGWVPLLPTDRQKKTQAASFSPKRFIFAGGRDLLQSMSLQGMTCPLPQNDKLKDRKTLACFLLLRTGGGARAALSNDQQLSSDGRHGILSIDCGLELPEHEPLTPHKTDARQRLESLGRWRAISPTPRWKQRYCRPVFHASRCRHGEAQLADDALELKLFCGLFFEQSY